MKAKSMVCAFGALTQLVDAVFPARWRIEVPKAIEARAAWIKFGVLAAVLALYVATHQVTIYQYVEPFGTVFFISTNAVLWLIACGILLASAVVPRFYCRYLCPLGASLAVVSLVSPRRIARVEQCGHCKVCEQRCPTHAIRSDVIDFKECVRCNVCEVALIEKAGVCQHDMEVIRPRLVQLKVASR